MASSQIKDVLLVGFGAVGAIYSLILQRSGQVRVTAVARSNYKAVKEHGFHIKSGKYGEIKGWRPDRLVNSVVEAADRPYSYVFLTTKAIPERTPTPSILKPLLSSPYVDSHPQPTYVLFQNGLGVERDLYEAAKKIGKGEPSIISTAVYIGTNLLGPNVVEHNHFDRVTMGAYRHNNYTTEFNSAEETVLLKDLGNILEAGGSEITIVPEIQRKKFSKNLWNIAFASIATLTQNRLPALWRPPPADGQPYYAPYVSPTTAHLIDEYTLPTVLAIMKELVVLGRAIGYPDSPDGLPSSIGDEIINNTKSLHVVPESNHKPSMLLDMEQDQPIEVEVIVGEVVRMAKSRGIEIPRVEMLYALLLVIQNQIFRKAEEHASDNQKACQ